MLDSTNLAGTGVEIPEASAIELLKPHFDARYYCERYPDIDIRYVDPLEHYFLFGWKEKRDPCDWFSTSHYLSRYRDISESGINPFLHYVLCGKNEGRVVRAPGDKGSYELELDPAASFVSNAALRELIAFPPRPLEPSVARANPGCLDIHWAVPDFAVGSGGHMTIFRLIRWLELAGHQCQIWLTDHNMHETAEAAYEDVVKYFPTVRAPVRLAEDGLDAARGDAIVATGWQTVARVLNATGFAERFYFVQDHEPSFYPMGSHALAAAWTYTQDLACICASPWLSQRLQQEYGRWATHFWLAYDHDIYFPSRKPRRRTGPLRIALYARFSTARRAVELAVLALEHLAAKGVAFHVDLFGEDSAETSAPFPCTRHGILGPQGLAEVYRGADLGICFSSTNYSLVPQEMMGCGLPVVEIDTASTRAIFPDGVVTFAGPHPLDIARELEGLLADPKRRRRQSQAASRWVGQFSWEASGRSVEQAILQRLELKDRLEPAPAAPEPSRRKRGNLGAVQTPMKASVCIPTYNGGELLKRVVDQVRSQRAPWPFEVVIVDSSSSDGSVERLERTGMVPLRIKRIKKSEFQHGRTRNVCASLARGEFLAFITQDALPADEFWLYNLVSVLEHFPNAAGAFGKHLAWPSACPFTRHGIAAHFENLLGYPLALSRTTTPAVSDPQGWRQVLHYFSDNNACLRRSVWSKLPYPEVDYGEDQVWADRIIQHGYEKVYVPTAVVYHSHDYSPAEIAERAETEAYFFGTHFGYELFDPSRSFPDQLASMNNADIAWARENRLSEDAIERRLLENKALLFGRARGLERARREARALAA